MSAVKSANKLKFKKLHKDGPHFVLACVDVPAFIVVMPDGIVVRVWDAVPGVAISFDHDDVTHAGQWWADDVPSAKKSIAAFYSDGLDAAVFTSRGLSSELIAEIAEFGAGGHVRGHIDDNQVRKHKAVDGMSWEEIARFSLYRVRELFDGNKEDVNLYFQMIGTFTSDGQSMDESHLSALAVLGRDDLIEQMRRDMRFASELGLISGEGIFH